MIKLGRSKKGQKKKKRAENEQKISHVVAWFYHAEHPIQKSESNMSRHALTMSRHAKVGLIAEFKVMPQHAKSMPRHDDV